MDPTKFIEGLKLKPQYLLPVAITAGCVLFLPVTLLKTLGLESLPAGLRPAVGVVLLLSSALLVSHLLFAGGGMLSRWRSNRDLDKSREAAMAALSPIEKGILKECWDRQDKTITLRMSNGHAGALVGYGIVFQSSSISSMIDLFPYTIQPWAWEYLRKHPDALAGAVDRNERFEN